MTIDGFRLTSVFLLFILGNCVVVPHLLLLCRDRIRKSSITMTELRKPAFDVDAFLMSAGLGPTIVELAPKESFFSQGDPADSVFSVQKGRAKVTVVSHAGKEATITIVSASDFVGESALAAVPGLRLSTATAITACSALKIMREEMIRVMHDQHDFSDLFMKFLLERSMRIQADLVDQLFNSAKSAWRAFSC